MKKSLMMFAAIFCCIMAMPLFSSCDDEEGINLTVYSYGFEEAYYSSTSDDLYESNMLTEMNAIENAFKTALGVDGVPFYSYEGGDAAVISACEKAIDQLNQQTFVGRYIFAVKKTTSDGTTTLATWSNKTE